LKNEDEFIEDEKNRSLGKEPKVREPRKVQAKPKPVLNAVIEDTQSLTSDTISNLAHEYVSIDDNDFLRGPERTEFPQDDDYQHEMLYNYFYT
jgi:hypothetical protein